MKLLAALLGICFIFSVSQKTFACPCEEGKKAEATATTKVADANKATPATSEATDSHSCTAGKQCGDEKACSCSKDKKGMHMHKHKDGKPCDCADKSGKMES